MELSPTAGTFSAQIDSVLGPDGISNVNAMRFEYIGATQRWQELAFTLTESIDEVRTETAESATSYQTVWISYDLYIPSGYAHTGASPLGGANNKGWLYLWNGNYEDASSTQSSTSYQFTNAGDRGGLNNRPQVFIQRAGNLYEPTYTHPDHLFTSVDRQP